MGNGTSTEAEHDTDDGSPPRCPPPPLRIPKPHEGEGREQVVSPLPTAFTDKYEVVGEIGRGAFGCVYKVRDRRTKAVYAAKHVELNDSNRKEVEIQAGLDNCHVVRILDTISAPSTWGRDLCIVMEHCSGGNLKQWIQRNRRRGNLSEKMILQMLFEICEAVYNCHSQRIIHRDLKPENVLLDSERRVKLADFGVARVLDRASVAKSFCGTPPYMAPELFLSYLGASTSGQAAAVSMAAPSGYDSKCDVWSIGCILWDMANSAGMFVHDLGRHLGHNVAFASSESIGEKEITERIDSDVPMEFILTKRLLHQMLLRNPEKRASLSDILQDVKLRRALENPIGGHWSDIFDKDDI